MLSATLNMFLFFCYLTCLIINFINIFIAFLFHRACMEIKVIDHGMGSGKTSSSQGMQNQPPPTTIKAIMWQEIIIPLNSSGQDTVHCFASSNTIGSPKLSAKCLYQAVILSLNESRYMTTVNIYTKDILLINR